MAVLESLKNALTEEGALLEIIAPRVVGVEASDRTWIEAAQTVDGGPSVLYDAIALLTSDEGARHWRRSRLRGTLSRMLSPT